MEKRKPHCKLSIVKSLLEEDRVRSTQSARQGAVSLGMNFNDMCPVCGVAELVHDTRDQSYTYKGESTILSAVTGDYCTACGESILDAKESQRTMEMMQQFHKQVNSAIVDPSFIIKIRKKLHLEQKEAAEIFGGGVNAFSRYETGKTKPSLSLVKLLKVLDKHPELLSEIRTA